jgi:hypothetical protein
MKLIKTFDICLFSTSCDFVYIKYSLKFILRLYNLEMELYDTRFSFVVEKIDLLYTLNYINITGKYYKK